MKIKYTFLLAGLMAFTACNDPEDVDLSEEIIMAELPELTSGEADFSNYISLGSSLTAGFTDGALFVAGQENSLPNILAQNFAAVGGGSFTQPLMNDNTGGLLLGGQPIGIANRLVFNGSGPARLETVVPKVSPTTDLTSNPAGPFNNMAVPGAKGFHLLAPGYGNMANLQAGLANPYFVRMASTPDATVLQEALAQNPTFFTLWIGNNDVLGYAATGGDGSNPITDQATFSGAYDGIVAQLTAQVAQGVVANIPNLNNIPFFTTVPHNPVPLDEATAAAVNQAYLPYNGGLQLALEALAGTGLLSEGEVARRTITFAAGEGNAVVIEDETLTDLGAINPSFAALPKIRQATAEDLLLLPASSFIGTLADPDNPLSVNGVAVPLADNWVLIPSEQEEIAMATANFNATIESVAAQQGLGLVDANGLLSQLATTGLTSDNFTMSANLVTGGAFSLDGVHLTARGYAFIANEFLKEIDATFGSNFQAAGQLNNIGNFPTNYSPALQ